MNKRIIPLLVALVATPAIAQPRNPARPAAPSPQRPASRPTAPARPAATARPATTPTVAAPAPTPTPPVTNPTGPGQNIANGVLTAQQVAERIQGFYDRTTDFQADFVQVSHNPLYGADERRAGHVMFRKPGRMRFNYAPVPQQQQGDVIVSDGTTLLAYQAVDRQALRQNITQSQLPTAIAFLAGTGRITDSFTFRLLDANAFQYPNGYVLELRPTTPQPTYERLVFYVDRASFQVTRTAIIDAHNNTNRFDFLRPQVNLDIPESTFRWTPPAGTSIVTP